ncbi:TolB family protein [Methanosarcina acetivorans]|nr:TolB family protein [Methanosarcina acetivorans]
MLKNMLILFLLSLSVIVGLANPASEDPNINVTSLDEILQIEKGFMTISTEWSPDVQYLLVTCSKSDSPSTNIVKHYLLDTNSHTFGEIDYGVHGPDTNGILQAKWTPSGDKICFEVSGYGPTGPGNCYIFCNSDGTNLRGVGTNYTDLSKILENRGDIGSQRNLKWSPDSSKIAFEWQKPGNASTGVFIANGNGTNAHELSSATYPQPAWYDSGKVFIVTDEGTVDLINESSDLIDTFQPEDKDEKYWGFSLSPDRKKILLVSGLPDSFDLHTYISDTDGSNLKGNVSFYDGDNPEDTNILTKEYWQPNGSLLLVNQNRNLYIVEGNENNKRLLYEGNASEPQWFPDGKKILFVENKNKLYSIDIDGTNLSFITNFGPTPSHSWYNSDKIDRFSIYSISPSGDVIVFASALNPDTGKFYKNETDKILESENDSSKYSSIAAPLFIVNCNGSSLTQVTPTTKGRFDMLRRWRPDGKQFTIESYSLYRTDWEDSLVDLNNQNSSSMWTNMTVTKIIEREDPATVGKAQNSESNSINTSQVTENKETTNKSPSFMFLQLFVCIMGVWLLHKAREQ